MIRNLQSLRGVAAVLIFVHHFGFRSAVANSFGDFATDFFLMLSGFVLFYATECARLSTGAVPRLRPFVEKRLTKIYPTYLLCWLAAIVLFGRRGSLASMALGAAMLQSWVPNPTVYFACNPVSWFMSDLAFCYLIFVPFYRLIISHRRRAWGALAAMIAVWFAVALTVDDDMVHAIVYINPLMQAPTFLIGMMLGGVFLAVPKLERRSRAVGLQTAAIALAVAALVCSPTVSTRLTFGAYWWVVSGALLLVFAATDGASGVINRVLQSRPMMWVGSVSFCLYLIHYLGIDCWQKVLTRLNLEPQTELQKAMSAAVLLVVLLGVSYLVSRYFEKPLYRQLKNKLKN